VNANVLSGTTISGNAIYENGIHVPNSLSVSNNLTGNLTSGAITISGSLIPTFTTVNASVISGTTISGNSAFLGSLTVTGTETDGTINASVISGTTISGNNIYANNSVYIAGNPIGMQLIYSGAITNVSTVTISGLNSNTEYKLRFNNVHSGTAGTTEIRFNNDSSLRYAWTTFSATNGGTANNGNNSQAQILTQNFTNADGQSEMYEMNFSSPPNLSSGVSIYGSGLNEAVYNANIQISTFAGYYLSSSGVSLSSISLLTSAGQFKSGRILLYKMGA
jgi:cytoskeletal protein CcmA (bactofilin family)